MWYPERSKTKRPLAKMKKETVVSFRVPETTKEKKLARDAPLMWMNQPPVVHDVRDSTLVVKSLTDGVIVVIENGVLQVNQIAHFRRQLHTFVSAVLAKRGPNALLWVDATRTSVGVAKSTKLHHAVNRLKTGINWEQGHYNLTWARDSTDDVWDAYAAFVVSVRNTVRVMRDAKEERFGVDPCLQLLQRVLGKEKADLLLCGGLSPTQFVNLVTDNCPEHGNTDKFHIDQDCSESLSTSLSLGGNSSLCLDSPTAVTAKCQSGTIAHIRASRYNHRVGECDPSRESYVSFFSHAFGISLCPDRIKALNDFIDKNREKLEYLRGPLDGSKSTNASEPTVEPRVLGMKRLVDANRGNLKTKLMRT